MTDDAQLLRRFVEEHSQPAFTEFVLRHLDWVYQSAFRRTRGRRDLAEEVAQQVFIAGARNAAHLARHPAIPAWLYTATRYAASRAIRTELRRCRYESAAYEMNEIERFARDSNWEEVRAVLDGAMDRLPKRERETLILRFFCGETLAKVGASFGLSEDGVRKRLSRSLEKLKKQLARDGLTSTAAALSVMLENQAQAAAPDELKAIATSAASSAGSVVAAPLAKAMAAVDFMHKGKLALALAASVIVFVAGAYLESQVARRAFLQSEQSELKSLTEENRRLKAQIAGGRGLASITAVDSAIMVSDAMGRLRKKLSGKVVSVSKKDLTLTAGFTELFGLTPDERKALQATLDNARGRMTVLMRANTLMTLQPDGKAVIDVHSFPTEGGKVYDDLLASFGRVLGPERNAEFNALDSDSELEAAFADFGTSQQTLVVSWKPSADATGYDYRVDYNSNSGVGRSAHGAITINNQQAFDNYAFESLGLSKFGIGIETLPPGFGPKK